MKKIIFFCFFAVSILFTAYAEEAKTVKKSPSPLLSPKKPKPAECVAPPKPATPAAPATPAKPAEAAKPVKSAQPAKAAVPAKPVDPVKPALGTCPPEAEKPAVK